MAEVKPVAVPSSVADGQNNVVTTERFTRLETELATRSRMQTAVAELGQAALTNVDAALLTAQACALVADTLAVHYCRVLEYLPEQQRLIARASVGWSDGEKVDEIDSEATFTFLANEPVVFSDLSSETRFDGSPVLDRVGVVSGVSVTLPGRDTPTGVLGAYTTSPREFRTYEIEFVQSIANVLAAAIESKRARQELAESRAQISRREKLGGIGSWSWSRGKREWQWSDEIYRMLGVDDDTPVDLDMFMEHVARDDRSAFSELIDHACRNSGEFALEHRLISADGEVRVVRTVVEAIFGSSRKPLRILGTTQDITDSTLAAQEQSRLSALIELAAQEWRMTCDAIDAPVIVTDANLTMLRVNDRARQLLRMSFDEAIGRQLPSAALGEPWATTSQLATVVCETGVAATVRAHDSIRGKSWDITARALNAGRASDDRVVIVANDVTAQAERDQIRHDADLLDGVTQVINAIASRTGEPLQTLSNILGRQLENIHLASDELRKARSATHDLTRLFRNLEEYARPFALHSDARPVGSIVERAIDAVAPLAARRNVRIQFECADDVEPMLVNESRLQQLFRDVLTLFVERAQEDEMVNVEIASTRWRREEWIGVVISTRGQIFSRAELQWALDPTLPHVEGDDGLRLSIDQRVVEEHGGVMLMVNRPEEQSSFISLRFPPVDDRAGER